MRVVSGRGGWPNGMKGGENEKNRCNQPIFFLFLHRCSVERRGNDFIEKKACFRLSDRVNLDNLLCLHG